MINEKDVTLMSLRELRAEVRSSRHWIKTLNAALTQKKILKNRLLRELKYLKDELRAARETAWRMGAPALEMDRLYSRHAGSDGEIRDEGKRY